MASNGLLNFQGTNKATFVGASSNIALDVVNSSLGIGITGTGPPSSNLYITGNAYVTSDISVGGVLNMGVVNVAARHTLEAITALGASTPSTLTLTNTGTSLVASGDVTASTLTLTNTGTSLVASGDVTVDTNTFHVDTTNNRVGIGEASPAELVHIRGSNPQLLIEGESNENANIDFSSGPAYRNRRHQIQTEHYALSGHATSNKMHFRVNAGGENTPSIRMTVRGDGNVGIGLTDPSTLLSLHEPNGGAGGVPGGVNTTPSTDENYGISWRSTLNSFWNGSTGSVFGTATAINAARIYYEAKNYTQVSSSVAGIHGVLNVSVGETEASAKTPCMTWTSNKTTGIGTESPGNNKCYVNGAFYATSGSIAGSDDRIKYNESDIIGALATIDKLKPQKYEKITTFPWRFPRKTWIPTDDEWETVKNTKPWDGFSYNDEYGFVAQDVRRIPEMSFLVSGDEVDENDNQTPLGLNYQGIFVVAVKAIQELNAELQAEKEKVRMLEDHLTRFTAQVTARLAALESKK